MRRRQPHQHSRPAVAESHLPPIRHTDSSQPHGWGERPKPILGYSGLGREWPLLALAAGPAGRLAAEEVVARRPVMLIQLCQSSRILTLRHSEYTELYLTDLCLASLLYASSYSSSWSNRTFPGLRCGEAEVDLVRASVARISSVIKSCRCRSPMTQA